MRKPALLVPLMLCLLMIAGSIIQPVRVSAIALQAPLDYRLPFVGDSVITTRPGCGEYHKDRSYEAIDFAMYRGRELYATRAGEIVASYGNEGNDYNDGFGHLLKIKHDDGNTSWYAHLNSFVKTNGRVTKGELVATAGNTGGTSTGPHLHFEVRNSRNQSIWIRDMPGITWKNGDPNTPCQTSVPYNYGKATGPALDTPYQAQYVNQSFQSTMTAGSTQRVQVHVLNTGSATWDSNTKIAPAPRDKTSPFYDSATWESGARIMSAGRVAPGETKVFEFVLRAPTTQGQYRLDFAFVQEGVTWFTVPYDGFINFTINVKRSDEPPYQAQYVNQSFQSTMTAGSTQRVQVHVLNTGSATWDSNTKIAPAPRDKTSPFYDSATWESGARIMSAGRVAPGETKVFEFVLRAPTTPGQYRLDFAFVQEGVTWFTAPYDGFINFTINVTPSGKPYEAQYVNQSFQSTMTAGSTQRVQVHVLNTGSATWDSNTKIAPAPRDKTSPFYDSATWESGARIMSAGRVAPGETKVFEFVLRAPTTQGQYRLDFAFVQEGVTWFTVPYDGFINFTINVKRSDEPPYQAQYVNQSFQSTMTAGSTQRVQVHVLNTGSATWDSNTKIAPAPRDKTSPFYDPATWESGARIMSAGSVAPEQTKVFEFVLRAPTTPGQYRLDFAFVQEGVTWFNAPYDGFINFPITVIP